MKVYIHSLVILVIHLISLITIFNGGLLVGSIAIFLVVFLLLRKTFKLYPVVLGALPVKDTVFFSAIQLLFLLLTLVEKESFTGMVSWIGILVVEAFRMWMLPPKLEESRNLVTLKDDIAKMNMAYKEIRVQRHDFLKHVNVLDYLVNERKYYELKEYFKGLLGDYRKTNSAVKGEEGHISALLMEYLDKAEKENIQITYDLELALSSISMRTVDQVKLIGNLLENAVEAAAIYQQNYGNAKVYVKTQAHAGIYKIEISNSAFFKNPQILDHLFERYEVTTKGRQHEGLGTYIIRQLVDRYSGNLSYRFKNNVLTIVVKIPIVNE